MYGARCKFDDPILLRLMQTQIVVGLGPVIEEEGYGEQHGKRQPKQQEELSDLMHIDLNAWAWLSRCSGHSKARSPGCRISHGG